MRISEEHLGESLIWICCSIVLLLLLVGFIIRSAVLEGQRPCALCDLARRRWHGFVRKTRAGTRSAWCSKPQRGLSTSGNSSLRGEVCPCLFNCFAKCFQVRMFERALMGQTWKAGGAIPEGWRDTYDLPGRCLTSQGTANPGSAMPECRSSCHRPSRRRLPDHHPIGGLRGQGTTEAHVQRPSPMVFRIWKLILQEKYDAPGPRKGWFMDTPDYVFSVQ